MKHLCLSATLRSLLLGLSGLLVLTGCQPPLVSGAGPAPLLQHLTLAFARQGELWLRRAGAGEQRLTRLHLSDQAIWSLPQWSPDVTHVVATVHPDPAHPDATTLVAVDLSQHTWQAWPDLIDAHHRLIGWITNDLALIAGDDSAPGLTTVQISTGTSTQIVAFAVAAQAITPGNVWFVLQQQVPGPATLLLRWNAATGTTTTAAYLPGWRTDASGLSCGTISLSADGQTILYDTVADPVGIPCAQTAGAWLMHLTAGGTWQTLGRSAYPSAKGRLVTLAPDGGWVADVQATTGDRLAVRSQAEAGAALSLEVPMPSVGSLQTLTIESERPAMLITSTADSATPPTTILTEIALDGSLERAAIAGNPVAVAPVPITIPTLTDDVITCPPLAPVDATTIPNPAALRIAVIGDSLAQGWGTSNPGQCSFAAQLATTVPPLTPAGPPALVQIAGMGGYRIDQMAPAVPNIVGFAPDVAVIELGTNDERESWPLQGTQANLAAMLATLRQAHATHLDHPLIVCLGVWPSPDFDNPAQISPYDALIAQECDRAGGVFLDIGPLAALGEMGLPAMPDNWHPNDRGALNIARLISAAIAAHTPANAIVGQ